MTKPIYRPISCHFYDELEALATHQTICHLHYRNEMGDHACVESRLIDFITLNKEEFLIGENDLQIRLDQIVSVNNLFPGDAKYC